MFCSSCGSKLEDTSPFCGSCGARVAELSSSAAPAAAPAAFTPAGTGGPAQQVAAVTTPASYPSAGQTYTPPTMNRSGRRLVPLRVIILILSALGAGAFFLPWISEGSSYFTLNISGYDLAKEVGGRVWNPTSPWYVLALMGVSALASVGLLAARRGRALALIPVVTSALVLCVVGDYLSQSTQDLSYWSTGFWGVGVLGVLILVASLSYIIGASAARS